jgi:hypothetical protein
MPAWETSARCNGAPASLVTADVVTRVYACAALAEPCAVGGLGASRGSRRDRIRRARSCGASAVAMTGDSTNAIHRGADACTPAAIRNVRTFTQPFFRAVYRCGDRAAINRLREVIR